MTVPNSHASDAFHLAKQIREGQKSARATIEEALEGIRQYDPQLNCFTKVMAAEAREQAHRIDERIAAGDDPGPLAGVPFGVKNLFDIAGVVTLAGSKINASRAPAAKDATVVARLKNAGAVLVGALNMDEYAYGFTTENTHYGVTRNPHDLERVAGGSSGGSAAAVAAGLLPLTLGSDTNGSIRVPAAFCGVFGLKPTYGRISRAGSYPFVASLDHVGPFARSVRDLAVSFDVMHGPDPLDPVASRRESEETAPQIEHGAEGLRIARAGGYFAEHGLPEVFEPVQRAAAALGATDVVAIPGADQARAAAYLITACEGANLHREDLQQRPQDFDPLTLPRFLAGSLLPANWYVQAQRFRSVFRDQVREIFSKVDVLLAPATPCPAVRIGQPTILLNGTEVASRPNIGIFTQPVSYIGLPVVTVPVFLQGSLPLGVQVIGAPYQEAKVLRVAWELERLGVASAPVPVLERAI